MSVRVGGSASAGTFPKAAHDALNNTQLRRNVRNATGIIQKKRNAMAAEMPDWEALRTAGHAIKTHTLRFLDHYLLQFEENVTNAGGIVHWATDADEANAIVTSIVLQHAAKDLIKVKTMTSDEVGLNQYLAQNGIEAHETDLADLIVQLGNDRPSHIVVPALHKNRAEIRDIFQEHMPLKALGIDELGYEPAQLAEAARRYLRQKFLNTRIGFSGANFAVADTGAVVVVESEGNGRMCITLPDVLITLVGIEKLVPTFQDLEVFLQTLSRSATGERMNPYNSIWTGVTPGDGPQEFHVILLDNGRTTVLADPEGRETLNCIRCGACLNVCPVYHQTGGHAYGSTYSGPIGAILTPQLQGMDHAQSLPFASSLCGACYEVCPVKINIPEILILLRGKVVEQHKKHLIDIEGLAMKAMSAAFSSGGMLNSAERFAQLMQWPFVHADMITRLPGMLSGWSDTRDLKPLPKESFREWWKKNKTH